MKLSLFLKSKWLFLSLQGAVLFIVFMVFQSLHINRSLSVLIFVSLTILIAFSVAFEYYQRNVFYTEIYKNLNQLDVKYLIAEMMVRADFAEGEILEDILKQTTKSMNDKIAEHRHINEEYADYIETWIHEVKLPIATIGLLCENNKSEVTRDIETELHRIDSFVEQALYYAKGNTLEKDCSIKKCRLDTLVKTAVKSNSKSIIFAKGNLKFDNLEQDVYCDSKWLSFILTQIISNAIKYKADNLMLCFSSTETKDNITLHIKDDGVGIEEKDINRVFIKGFTGENGRNIMKSTGIGLYLCKKQCDKMNLSITISSKINCGTTVSITFPKDSRILLET